MSPIQARTQPIEGGCILYDATSMHIADASLFDLAQWAARGALEQVVGGRGSVAILKHDSERWVLRHYRRGGLIAQLSRDRYLWLGAERTRSFSEWRLLAHLLELGLPVPRPIAARYLRSGLTYTADLLTMMLEDRRTLAQALSAGDVAEQLWRDIGRTVARFHAHGVHHADLNAHNILLPARADAPSGVYLLDFDRGRIRARGAWEERVLARLKRSLEKVSGQAGRTFDERAWRWLLDAYSAALAEAG